MQLCAPAIIYIGFSLTHILIDIYKQFFNSAFIKFIIMILFTIILNILCKRGLGIISWFIVFVPFIFMTVISSTLLFAFGLNPQSSNTNITRNNTSVIPLNPFMPGWNPDNNQHRHKHHHHNNDHHSHKHHHHHHNNNHHSHKHHHHNR